MFDRLAHATTITRRASGANVVNALHARYRHRSKGRAASKYNLPHVEA